MKIAILAKTICLTTPKIIDFFENKDINIDCVIIEKSYRKKFSVSECKYRNAHDKYNRKSKKYPLIRRMARRLWDILPHIVRKMILTEIYCIPVLNRFSLRKYCENRNIKVFEVLKHSSDETRQIFESCHTDYALMASSNWLLKEPIISLRSTRIINAHSGWLPKHKGLDSIAWSIKENDPVGLTTHFIDKGIDSGPILHFYQADFKSGDDFNTVCKKVNELQAFAFYDTLIGLENNTIVPMKQNTEYKSHIPMSFKELCEIDEILASKYK
jgi:folate-dependent phosphoribosylglycinamide formyltransferase PurN